MNFQTGAYLEGGDFFSDIAQVSITTTLLICFYALVMVLGIIGNLVVIVVLTVSFKESLISMKFYHAIKTCEEIKHIWKTY